MKKTQIERVASDLKEMGQVSRNHYLDLPYDKITRLSAIILKLREQGYDIETVETERDTVYVMKPKKIEIWNILNPDGTKTPYQKTIWK